MPEDMKKVKVPPAVGPCPSCIEKHGEGNNLLIRVYCRHNKSGAYMYMRNGQPSGIWEMRTPISQEAFNELIQDITQQAERLLKAFEDGVNNLTLGQGGNV